MVDEEQPVLFDVPPDWKKDWQGMPGYDYVDQESKRDLILHFRNEDDVQAFAKVVDQRITDGINLGSPVFDDSPVDEVEEIGIEEETATQEDIAGSSKPPEAESL